MHRKQKSETNAHCCSRAERHPPPPYTHTHASLRFLLSEGGGDVRETIETRARRRHKRARIITFASLVALQLPFFQAWSAFPFSPVTVIPGHILLLLYHYSLAAPPLFLLLQSGLKNKKKIWLFLLQMTQDIRVFLQEKECRA